MTVNYCPGPSTLVQGRLVLDVPSKYESDRLITELAGPVEIENFQFEV